MRYRGGCECICSIYGMFAFVRLYMYICRIYVRACVCMHVCVLQGTWARARVVKFFMCRCSIPVWLHRELNSKSMGK